MALFFRKRKPVSSAPVVVAYDGPQVQFSSPFNGTLPPPSNWPVMSNYSLVPNLSGQITEGLPTVGMVPPYAAEQGQFPKGSDHPALRMAYRDPRIMGNLYVVDKATLSTNPRVMITPVPAFDFNALSENS